MVNISKIFKILNIISLKLIHSYVFIFLLFLSFFNNTLRFIPRRFESTYLTIITSDIDLGTFAYIWKYSTSNWTWSNMEVCVCCRVELTIVYNPPDFFLPILTLYQNDICRNYHLFFECGKELTVGATGQHIHQVAVGKRSKIIWRAKNSQVLMLAWTHSWSKNKMHHLNTNPKNADIYVSHG